MRFLSRLEFSCEKPDRLRKLLQSDSNASDRSQKTFGLGKGKLIVKIAADDVSSLRASFNSVTKLIGVYQEMEKLR